MAMKRLASIHLHRFAPSLQDSVPIPGGTSFRVEIAAIAE